MFFKYFSMQILFSRTFQDCPVNSSTFQDCGNPVMYTTTFISRRNKANFCPDTIWDIFKHFHCHFGWNSVKYARITITHGCSIANAITLEESLGRCLDTQPVNKF